MYVCMYVYTFDNDLALQVVKAVPAISPFVPGIAAALAPVAAAAAAPAPAAAAASSAAPQGEPGHT